MPKDNLEKVTIRLEKGMIARWTRLFPVKPYNATIRTVLKHIMDKQERRTEHLSDDFVKASAEEALK